MVVGANRLPWCGLVLSLGSGCGGRLNEFAGESEISGLVEWALPIQERHFADVKDGSLKLAREKILRGVVAQHRDDLSCFDETQGWVYRHYAAGGERERRGLAHPNGAFSCPYR